DSKLENLRQRIAILTTLVPFDLEDTKNYITHRLKVGGHKEPGLFTTSAVKLIWDHSSGVPRNINTLCFNALLLARSLEQPQIDASILREVLTDSDWDHFSLNAYTPTSDEWSAQAAPALLEPTHEAERLSDTLGGLDVDP